MLVHLKCLDHSLTHKKHWISYYYIQYTDFPGGSVVKNLPAHVADERVTGLIPGSGRSPGVWNGNPLQYSCLENSMDREAWWPAIHGVAKSQTRLSDWVCARVHVHVHTHTHTHSIYTTPIDRYFFKHKVEFFMALISATVKNSMVTPTHCNGDFREIEAGQIRRMVTDHFSLPWSLFLQVHPGSHRQVLGLSGNCSVVGRVFVFMMLLWIIFCQICVALALPGSTPVTGGFWPLRVARQDLMQTIHALPGPDGSTQQVLLFHSQKSEISWLFPFSPNKWKSEQLYLDKPGPCWSNSFLQIDEHECKWEFPK